MTENKRTKKIFIILASVALVLFSAVVVSLLFERKELTSRHDAVLGEKTAIERENRLIENELASENESIFMEQAARENGYVRRNEQAYAVRH